MYNLRFLSYIKIWQAWTASLIRSEGDKNRISTNEKWFFMFTHVLGDLWKSQKLLSKAYLHLYTNFMASQPLQNLPGTSEAQLRPISDEFDVSQPITLQRTWQQERESEIPWPCCDHLAKKKFLLFSLPFPFLRQRNSKLPFSFGLFFVGVPGHLVTSPSARR